MTGWRGKTATCTYCGNEFHKHPARKYCPVCGKNYLGNLSSRVEEIKAILAKHPTIVDE